MARKDELRSLAEQYAEKYGFQATQLDKGLEAFAVHLFAQEEGFDALLGGAESPEADLGEYVLRADDLGVDGVLVDDAGKRIVIVQSTWRSRHHGIEEKITSFASIVDRLRNPEFLKQGGEPAQELLGALPDQLRDGYSVELRFVTNLSVGDKDRILAAVDAANQALDEDDRPITLELFGGSELLRRKAELDSARSGAAVDEVTLKVQKDKALELLAPSNAPRKTLVAVIKGNELAELYGRRDVGNRLFTSNIRLPLTTKKVNPQIAKTATEAPHDFFYFNNGVSAVCKEFTFNGNEVIAKRFQIINGAQTVSALRKALRNLPNSDVYVLFRLTETDEPYGGPFTEDVIRYNNTQNPVKVSDFFANDPIQIWLSEHLSDRSGKGPMPAFYYVHKSGWRPGRARGRKQLKIDVLAGIRHAFLYGPTASYKEPATFFDRDQRYGEAFGIRGVVESTWDDETLAETCCAIAVNDRLQSIARDLKKDPNTKGLIEAKYLYRLSRYVTALVGVGLRAIMPTQLADYVTLMASTATFERFVNPLITRARDLVESEMFSLSIASVQPEYNFARDERAWLKLESLMRSAALTRIQF